MDVPPTWDPTGTGISQAEAQQQLMLGLYDLCAEAADCQFSEDLVDQLQRVRLAFMDEFVAKFPGHGKGRALWR